MNSFRGNVDIFKKISVGLLPFMIMLSLMAPVVNANAFQPNPDTTKDAEVKANEASNSNAETQPNPDTTKEAEVKTNEASNSNAETPKTIDEQGDGLEIGSEIVNEAVTRGAIPAPTINKVFYGDTTISGAKLHRDRVGGKPVRATVYVTLKGEDDTVKATLSVTPTRGTKWSVKLPEGKKVEQGDTVTVYQQLGEDKSPEVTENAQPSKASTVTLTMPTGKIWIEQTSSNIVNEDEQAEAVRMFNDANTEIAGDIKSVKFSIDGIAHAYYEVTYTDESTSGKVEATNLQIKQVTEYSRGAILGRITIADNVIKGKLEGEGPFDGIKVQLILNVKKEKSGGFCTDKGCIIDKDSSNPLAATLQKDGTFSYTLQERESLELDQIVGVSVKEPHKFVSCSTTTVKPVIPEKTNVKDPRKITDDDKGKLINAIKTAYTVNGESKLPNGTGDWDGVPAVIQIDGGGNVKIFSGNDVKGTWDPNNDYKFVPEKNADGSVKLNDGAQPKITIQAKDLLKNIKPEAPTFALSEDKKNITITPDEKDTDAKIIAVSYKGKGGKDQTTTATKADDGTWSITEGEGSVDTNGVITLSKDKVKGGTQVTATVTDKGGIAEGDTDPLTSDPGTLPMEEEETIAKKVKALGGLDPVALKKWVGDTVDWKKGVKAKDSATDKDKIKEYLNEASVSDASEPKTRTTENSGDFEGKVKVTFSDGSEIVVEKQMLYVSDLVSSSNKENLPDDALVVEFKLGEGIKVEDKDPNTGEVTKTTKGGKDSPVLYKEYKVKPGTDLSTYIHPTLKKTIFDLIDEKADKGYTEPVWKGQDANNAKNFVAASNNNVFTATATKTFKVTVKPNGGTGDEKVEIKKKDEIFKLPAANTFTPPNENQEFSGWKIGDDTNLKQPETEITITGDTEINAIWKPIEFKVEFKVDFKAGEGASGSMEDKTVTKGSEYELPTPTFTAPKDKVFAGWKVGDKEGVKQAKERITITGNVTLTATWKGNTVDITFDGAGGGGSMEKASVTKGSEYTLPDNGFTAPENKKFDGWMVGTKKKSVGDKITVNDNTIVKAIWKDIMIKIIYDPNGGNWNNDSANRTIEVKKGTTITIMNAPVKDGFKFKYWKGSEYRPGDTYTALEDHTFIAAWEENKKPGTSDVNPSEPGSKDKNGTQSRGTSSSNSKNNRTPNVNPSEPGSKDKNGTQSRGTSSLNSKNNGTPNVNPSEPGSKDENGTQSRGTSSLNSKNNRTPNVNPSEPGSKDKNGIQPRGTSSLNSKNNRIPNTGDNGMNILYAFGLAFAACGVLVINRIYRKEK